MGFKNKTILIVITLSFTLALILTLDVSDSNSSDETISVTNNAIDDFVLLDNDPTISSTKTSQSIDFSYNQTNGNTRLVEYYYLTLDNYGNVSDFEYQVTINYSVSGRRFGALLITAGSYYTEEKEFIGSNLPGDFVPTLYGGVFDIHTNDLLTSGAIFGGNARKFDEVIGDICEEGIAKRVQEITVKYTRVNGGMVLFEVAEGENILFETSWRRGLKRPINVISLGLYIETGFEGEFDVSFTDLSFTVNSVLTDDWKGTTFLFFIDSRDFHRIATAICFLLAAGITVPLYITSNGFNNLKNLAGRTIWLILAIICCAMSILPLTGSIMLKLYLAKIACIAVTVASGVQILFIAGASITSGSSFSSTTQASVRRTNRLNERRNKRRESQTKIQVATNTTFGSYCFYFSTIYIVIAALIGSLLGFYVNKIGVAIGLLILGIVFITIALVAIRITILDRKFRAQYN